MPNAPAIRSPSADIGPTQRRPHWLDRLVLRGPAPGPGGFKGPRGAIHRGGRCASAFRSALTATRPTGPRTFTAGLSGVPPRPGSRARACDSPRQAPLVRFPAPSARSAHAAPVSSGGQPPDGSRFGVPQRAMRCALAGFRVALRHPRPLRDASRPRRCAGRQDSRMPTASPALVQPGQGWLMARGPQRGLSHGLADAAVHRKGTARSAALMGFLPFAVLILPAGRPMLPPGPTHLPIPDAPATAILCRGAVAEFVGAWGDRSRGHHAAAGFSGRQSVPSLVRLGRDCLGLRLFQVCGRASRSPAPCAGLRATRRGQEAWTQFQAACSIGRRSPESASGPYPLVGLAPARAAAGGLSAGHFRRAPPALQRVEETGAWRIRCRLRTDPDPLPA